MGDGNDGEEDKDVERSESKGSEEDEEDFDDNCPRPSGLGSMSRDNSRNLIHLLL